MTLIDDLRAACKKEQPKHTLNLLETGETINLLGTPASAGEGFVALEVARGMTVSVKEDAIADVQKVKDRLFLVGVKAGSSAVVRYEAVTTIKRGEEHCSCDKEKGNETVSRQNTGAGPGVHGLAETMGCTDCKFYWQCVRYEVNGYPQIICVPAVECHNICTGV